MDFFINKSTAEILYRFAYVKVEDYKGKAYTFVVLNL